MIDVGVRIISAWNLLARASFTFLTVVSIFFSLLPSESKECPQRGCFDCPMHQSDPYGNPHFQRRQREADHARAEHFISHGLADDVRRTAEL